MSTPHPPPPPPPPLYVPFSRFSLILLSKRRIEQKTFRGGVACIQKNKGGKKGEREAKIPLSSPTFDKVVLS